MLRVGSCRGIGCGVTDQHAHKTAVHGTIFELLPEVWVLEEGEEAVAWVEPCWWGVWIGQAL